MGWKPGTSTRSLFIGPDSRECGKCHEIRPSAQFSTRGFREGVRLLKSTCNPCAAAGARDWYMRNTERGLTNRRRLQLMADYGLTPAEYDELLERQGGLCAVCRQPETVARDGKVMRMPVDHCHDTGQIRGLLCHRCNRAIGMLGDDPEILRAAAEYIERGTDYCE